MKERGMIFNSEMVLAILDGRKTQTRRPVKYNGFIQTLSNGMVEACRDGGFDIGVEYLYCPYGKVGDRIYVRESATISAWHRWSVGGFIDYRIDYMYSDGIHGSTILPERFVKDGKKPKWCELNRKIPNGCIKEMSRIWLEITSVRVERVQEITESDCRLEGIGHEGYECAAEIDGGCGACANCDPVFYFGVLWNSIYKNWNDNPWVWVVEFKRIEK